MKWGQGGGICGRGPQHTTSGLIFVRGLRIILTVIRLFICAGIPMFGEGFAGEEDRPMDVRKYSEAYIRNMIALCMHPKQKKIEHFGGGELLILAFLSYSDSLSPKELSRATGASTAHVAKTLRNLEAKGEICRLPDPTDARKKAVSVTEAGKGRVERARAEVLEDLDEVMRALGEEDAAQLVRISGRLVSLSAERA